MSQASTELDTSDVITELISTDPPLSQGSTERNISQANNPELPPTDADSSQNTNNELSPTESTASTESTAPTLSNYVQRIVSIKDIYCKHLRNGDENLGNALRLIEGVYDRTMEQFSELNKNKFDVRITDNFTSLQELFNEASLSMALHYFPAMLDYWSARYFRDMTKHGFDDSTALGAMHRAAVAKMDTMVRKLDSHGFHENAFAEAALNNYLVQLWQYRVEVSHGIKPRLYLTVLAAEYN